MMIKEEEMIDTRDEELILGNMRRWLNGEPVWSLDEILQRWGPEFLMYRTAWDMGRDGPRARATPDRNIGLFGLRERAITEFGFALPCRELLDVLEKHQPILEVGAGTGYLTALMRHRNIDVIGTDPGPGQRFTIGRYDPWQELLQAKTAIRHYPERTVFCSWPSLYETWFRQALRAMRVGQRLIVIEEDACAEESAWDYRDVSFDREAGIPVPAWPMMNDRAGLYIKKRHVPMRVPKFIEAEEARKESWERWRNR